MMIPIARSAWMQTSIALLLILTLLAIAFYSTIESMVAIWIRSETFTHGFIILPISLWLIWGKRQQLFSSAPTQSLLALPFILATGFLWLLGYAVDALVVQQFAFVGVLIATIVCCIGIKAASKIIFPLGFLLFMVPVGEGLVPSMMELTASSTVWMIRATGIPVFREGLFFSLPSGNWSVVEACSGVRYLIASVTLGCLYAYLTYSSYSKRIIFIIISALVPIVANSVRAYIIVMLGHLSNMTIATGVDHLIYGWVFFGFVMLLLFWLGGFFADPPEEEREKQLSEIDSNSNSRSSVETSTKNRPSLLKNILLFVLIGMVSVSWPGLTRILLSDKAVSVSVALSLPEQVSGWRLGVHSWSWKPNVIGATRELTQEYIVAGKAPVSVYLFQFLHQEQGKELVSGLKHWVEEESPWRVISESSKTVRIDGRDISINTAVIRFGSDQLRVWSWYRIGDRYTSNAYVAKLLEAYYKLLGNRQDGTRIYLFTAAEKDIKTADSTLLKFTNDSLGTIAEQLDLSAGISP